jgi:hypothetical protein
VFTIERVSSGDAQGVKAAARPFAVVYVSKSRTNAVRPVGPVNPVVSGA